MLTKSNSFSRRTLLRGIGVSMALPWLESLSFAAGEKNQRCRSTADPYARHLHGDGLSLAALVGQGRGSGHGTRAVPETA